MKNRNIPFGYMFKDGIIIINEPESETVKAICCDYLSGRSMLEISETLNKSGIEYLTGITGWNKARIKRIIEDKRYIGTDIFPTIINHETYDELQAIKESRNTQAETDRGEDIYKITVPVLCPICGEEMKRRTDNRRKIQQKWVCQNRECRATIHKPDNELIADITELLNMLISNPEIITYSRDKEPKDNPELRRLENEIEHMIDSASPDKDTIRQKLLQSVSLKYANIDNEKYIAKLLKADFERASPLSHFSAELFARTVKRVLLYKDGTVGLILLNGQIINKENRNDTRSDN